MGIEAILIVKFFATAFVVVVLSLVAEYLSPRWAGILSGFPAGSAIALYIFAMEHGLTFTASSAIYNVVGLAAMQTCVFCFYWTGSHSSRFKLLLSIIGGILGYIIAAIVLSRFSFGLVSGIALALCSSASYKYMFRSIPVERVHSKTKFTVRVVAFRASVAAMLVILVTSAGGAVDHEWAGLFSAFPVTMFPLLVITHYSHGEVVSNTIIKHVPDGLGALLIYSSIISLVYPGYDLYAGMAFAFSGAGAYLCLYWIASEWWKARSVKIENANQEKMGTS